MPVNERLGIDIEINTDKVTAGLKAFQDQLSKAFGATDLSKLVEQMTKLEGVSAKATAGFRASAKDIENFAKAFTNGDLDAAKKKMEELSDTKKMKQWSKEYQAELALIMKQQEAANAAALKGTENNIKAQKKLLDAQIAAGNATVKTYSNSGYQPVNGGYVKSSVNTNLGLDDTHAAALKMNTAMAGTRKITDGIAISIGQMAARLTEFYSIRSGLFFLGNQFTTAFRGLIEFNQELHNTAAIANASSEQMAKLSEAAMSIATSSRFSAVEVMKSMKMLAQSGVSAADLPDVSKTVDMFATGAGSSLNDATKVLTTSMNVWSISGERSGRVANVLTAALNASKLEVNQLSTSLNYLGNQSSLSGKSLEETVGIISTMANAGISASTIGTGVSQLMSKLAAPGQKFKDLLVEYGIALKDISPRANNFADIIAKFEEKAIPAERMMAALEVRTGRTLASAVNIGSAAFREMEARITNTNAASVAYNESMKGTEAQLNVLRGEVMQSVSVTLNNLGVSFSDLKDSTQDFVVGLRSAESQFMLFSSAMVLGIAALSKAAMANPVLAGLTVVLAGVSWGVGKLGESTRETAKEIENITKASAEASGTYQRNSDDLYTLLSLVDKNKTSQEGYLTIQDANQKKIREILNLHPDLFRGLDTKKLKYSQLTEIIKKYNEERGKELNNDIISGNAAGDKINVLKTALAESQKYEADNENKGVFNFQQFTTNRLQQELKLAEAAQKTLIAANLAPRSDVAIELDSMGTPRARKVTPPPEAPRGAAVEIPDKIHKGSSAKSPEERAETILQRLGEDQKDLAEKLRYQKAKIERESAEVALKDKTLSEEDYLKKEATAVALLNKEYADKQIADRTNTFGKLAKTLDGAYTQPNSKNPTGHVSFDKRFNEDAVKMLIGNTNKNLNYQTNVVDAAAKAKELEKIRLMKPAAPEEKDNKLIGVSTDKREDRTMMIAMQTLALKNKAAWTGEELNRLAIGQTEHEIHSLQIKENAYQTDLNTLTLKKEKKGLDTSEQAYLDALPEKLEVINDKRRELIRIEKEQSNNGFWDNFTMGVRKSTVALGDFKSNYQALGEKLSSQLYGGTEGAINNTLSTWTAPDREKVNSLKDQISKLNQQKSDLEANMAQSATSGVSNPNLANQKVQLQGINVELAKQNSLLDAQVNGWTRFRDSMGKMLQDISSELQKFVVHLLVVAAAEKMVGLFASSAVPGTTANSTGVLQASQNNTTWTPPKFAEGGEVLNGIGGGFVPLSAGIKGVTDSVPAYVNAGEFIISRESTAAFGIENLRKINMQKFADGGLVGAASGSAASRGGNAGKQEFSLVINNVADIASIPARPANATEIVNIVSFDLAKRGQLHRAIKSVISN